MKTLMMMLCLLLTMGNLQAQTKNKNAHYTIEVNGNCETCKKRIEKAALSVSGVKLANWDVATHELSLIINEEKTSILEVKKAIAKVGHDTDEVKAEDSVYENLHSCCKYERNPVKR
ncbi:MAG: heavy-metal-associated domain-containing protein [Flavobacteriaceae bacterium]